MKLAFSQLEAFQDAWQHDTNPSRGLTDNIMSRHCIWKRPPDNMLKVNWDVAVDVHQQCSGLEGLIRDAASKVQLSFCCVIDHIIQPALAKSLALKKAMTLSSEVGFSHLIYEGDCKQLIQSTQPMNASPVILDIQAMLRAHIRRQVKFTYREANNTAHHLAKLTCSSQTVGGLP